MVRISLREVKAALSEIISLPSLVVTLETLAARRAVHFVKEFDLPGSIVEGDSEVSISAIETQCFHHPSCGHLVKNIMSSASSIQNYSFSYVHQQGNALTHALAKRVRLSLPILFWLKSVPLDIYKLYVYDFSSIK